MEEPHFRHEFSKNFHLNLLQAHSIQFIMSGYSDSEIATVNIAS